MSPPFLGFGGFPFGFEFFDLLKLLYMSFGQPTPLWHDENVDESTMVSPKIKTKNPFLFIKMISTNIVRTILNFKLKMENEFLVFVDNIDPMLFFLHHILLIK